LHGLSTTYVRMGREGTSDQASSLEASTMRGEKVTLRREQFQDALAGNVRGTNNQRASYTRRNASVAFNPPNANELESEYSTSAGRAWLPMTSN